MNIVVYFFVALVAALSVAFGLDWMAAPMSPMPASKFELRAAIPPPPPAVVARVEPRTVVRPEAPVATPPAAAPVKPAAAPAPGPLDQQPASLVASGPGTAAAAPPSAPRCDVDACASAYRSFTAADCTYQPSDGPRRLCTKGTPPAAATTPAAAPEARAQACNVAACSQSYPRSFSAADCTFQPSDGPRRVCTK